MRNRMISMLLVLFLCVSMLPIGAMTTLSADGTTTTSGVTPGAKRDADGNTMDSYTNLLDILNESRRAGRVWADKSVFKDGITLDMGTDGYSGPVMSYSDFLHVFSAMGSSLVLDELHPLDVVFILDTSASMSSTGEDQFVHNGSIDHGNNKSINKNPRLESAADALNEAFELLMDGGQYNRVALVTFDIGAQTVMPLGRYSPTEVKRTTKQSEGYHAGEIRYFTIAQCSDDGGNGRTGDGDRVEKNPGYDDRFQQQYYDNNGNPRFLDSKGLASDWKIIEINAVDEASHTSATITSKYTSTTKGSDGFGIPYIHTSSGTDTYWGILEGMRVLSTEKDTKLRLYETANGKITEVPNGKDPVATIQRTPIVVLLTDGAPNPNSTGTQGYVDNWWNGTGASTNFTGDDGKVKRKIERYDPANGLLVAATAAYQKQLVEQHYFGKLPSNPSDKNAYGTLVYNFGICMDDPASTVANTAHDGQVALAGLNPASLSDFNYEHFVTIRNWWTNYLGGGKPNISKTSYEYKMNHPGENDIKSLDYPARYTDVNVPTELPAILSALIKEFLNDAFTPVGGQNDVGVKDALTYMDPIGKYMEIKDIQSLLLFGELHELEPGLIEYYYANDEQGKPSAKEESYAYSLQYYKFKNDKEITNPCYGVLKAEEATFKLSDIEIYVKTTGNFLDEGAESGGIISDMSSDQTLYIHIPAMALPMQVATVTTAPDGTMIQYKTNLDKKDQSTPLRVFYDVGIADAIKTANGNIDMTKVSPDYVQANRSADKEKVYFYSNWYNKEKDKYSDYVTAGAYTFGDPVLTFSPSVDNRYYIFEKAGLLFERPDGSTDTVGGVLTVGDGTYSLNGTQLTPVTEPVDPDEWYYVMIDYYHPTNGLVRYALPRLGSEFGAGIGGIDGGVTDKGAYLCWYDPVNNVEKVYDPNQEIPEGYYVAAKEGGLRVGDLAAGIGSKTNGANATSTSDTYYLPTISSATEGKDAKDIIINIYLGNNGRLEIGNTQLLVTKTVETIGASDDDISTAEFNYTIELEGVDDGLYNAIKTTRQKDGTWRVLIQTIELLTNNKGLLRNSNGTLATVSDIDPDGKIIDGEAYYVYVGGSQVDEDYTYTLFDADRNGSFSADSNEKELTVLAYLVPVGDYDAGDWTFREGDGSLKEVEKFPVGKVDFRSDTPISFAFTTEYQSKTTYQTEELEFKNGQAEFTLHDGEGLLFIGLESGANYTVTEILEDEQVDDGIFLVKVTHKENDGANNNAPKVSSYYKGKDDSHDFNETDHTYEVSGETTAILTEEVHYFNFLPKVEKTEVDQAVVDGYAEVGDKLTYIIYWENDAIDYDKAVDGYVEALVTIVDPLDNGVNFVSAEFVKKIDDETYETITPPEGWEVAYDLKTHTVTWTIDKAEAKEFGYVRLTVLVNDEADQYWNDYEEEEEPLPENDYEILNRAGVQVEDGAMVYTDILHTPTGAPHKTETAVNTDEVSEKKGNLKKNDSGGFTGPIVDEENTITYKITYVNYTDDEAKVIVIDQLDDGVDFVSAHWNGVTLNAPSTSNPNPSPSVEQSGVKISYDAASRRVTWEITVVGSRTDGNVTMVVKVNEDAEGSWHYTADDGIAGEKASGSDYKVFNRASVQVGDHNPRITETIENPLAAPVSMPATGGMGTEVFMLIGAALLLLAAAGLGFCGWRKMRQS